MGEEEVVEAYGSKHRGHSREEDGREDGRTGAMWDR